MTVLEEGGPFICPRCMRIWKMGPAPDDEGWLVLFLRSECEAEFDEPLVTRECPHDLIQSHEELACPARPQ